MKPAPALIGALIALAALGGAVVLGRVGAPALGGAALALLVLAVLDALATRAQRAPRVERELPAVVPVGVEQRVTLRLRHEGRRPLALLVHDLHPGDWPVEGLPRRLRLVPAVEAALPYRLTPIVRGPAVFEACELWLDSPLGLWRRRRRVGGAQLVRVFPNFAPLARLALTGAEQASRIVGAHLKRRRGEGTDFQQLREYRVGDALRQIDWKASRRAQKLISREYQEEKNQQLVLLLDTGRRMTARDGELAHFDHVVNAALMVAYIALRQGDGVGLLACGGPFRHLPPRRGPGAIDALLAATYDLEPEAVATDYLEAATQLLARQPRRALVLLVTNVRDEDVEDLHAAVRLLRRRHLVCVASLREAAIDEGLVAPVRRFEDALRLGALARYTEERSRAHESLRAQGVEVLDVTCPQLPGALVEHYLAVKRAARL